MYQESNDSVNMENMHKCAFCETQANMKEHIRMCENLQFIEIEQKPTFYRIKQHGNLCKSCWNLFDADAWSYHRKAQTCKKANRTINQSSIRQHSIYPYSEPINRSPVVPLSHRYFSQEGYKQYRRTRSQIKNTDNHVMADMMGIVQGLLSPLLRQWIKDNEHINIQIITAHLSHAVLQFGREFLNKQIEIPTWEDMKNVDAKIQWETILEQPENLFNQKFLDEKIIKMPVYRRRKVIGALNKFALKFNGLIKKRQKPKAQKKLSRARSYVKIIDVMLFIRDLFATRKKQVVHFAIDCLVILLCGQRFLADLRQMEKRLLDLLNRNETKAQKQRQLTFKMKIGKSQMEQQVALNIQLLNLLDEFKWLGFHRRSAYIIERMRFWLGIHGYSFKDTMLNAVSAISTDLRLAQHVAGHKSVNNTRRYTKLVYLGDVLKVVSKIIVPDLHARFGQFNSFETVQYYKSLEIQHLQYAVFKADWLRGPQGLLSRLYSKNYIKLYENDMEIDFMAQSFQDNIIQQQQKLHKQPQRNNNNWQSRKKSNTTKLGLIEQKLLKQNSQKGNEISQQQSEQECQNRILVYGTMVIYKEGQFEVENFYVKIQGHQGIKCFQCSKTIISGVVRYRCNYCCSDYHVACAKDICRCTKTPENIKSIPKINSYSSSHKSTIKVSMPKTYLSKFHQSQHSIKKLLNIRAFRYVRTPVFESDAQLSKDYWQGAPILQINGFETYLSGQYFPPIHIRPKYDFQMHSVFGMQFGVYASENIQKGILIGEYASDLVLGKDLILCKKLDSTMFYSGKDYQNKYYLAPIKYSGYILLVNCANNSYENNCSLVRALTHGSLRILLYTNRLVRKGDQLLYSYGNSYHFK